MKYLLLIFLSFLSSISMAQGDCSPAEATRMLNDAKAELKKGHYEKALNKCNAATNCDPNLAEKANALILKIYKDIEQQKENAVKNERRALAAEDSAKQQKNIAEQRRLQAEEETRKAQSLALTSAANLAIYKDGDVTKGFRYAQYAWEKDSNNLDAQTAFYRSFYQPSSEPYSPFYYTIDDFHLSYSAPISDDTWKVILSPCGDKILYQSPWSIDIWDIRRNEKVWHMPLSTLGIISDIKFSKDSKKIFITNNYLFEHKALIYGFDICVKDEKVILEKSIEDSLYLMSPILLDNKHEKIAYIMYDANIKITNIENDFINIIIPNEKNIIDICFSPNGDKLAFINDSSSIAIWDINANQIIDTFTDINYRFSKIVFSPNGEKIATIDRKANIINIWDITNSNQNAKLTGHTQKINSIVFSTNSRNLVSTSSDCSIKVWDIEAGELLANCIDNMNDVYSAAFSIDGEKIASISVGSPDISVRMKIWDIRKPYILTSLSDTLKYVDKINMSLDKEKLATTSYEYNNYCINLWEVKNGKLITSLSGHTNKINSVIFSPDNSKIVSASNDSTIRIWNILGNSHYNIVKNIGCIPIYAMFSRDGGRIIFITENNLVKIWNIGITNQVTDVKNYQTYREEQDEIKLNDLLALDDIEIIVLDGCIEILNITQNATIGHISYDSFNFSTVFENAVFLPNKRRIIYSLSASNLLGVWDNGNYFEVNTNVDFPVKSIGFSSDEKKIVSSQGHNIKIYDSSTGKIIVDLENKVEMWGIVTFSLDNKDIKAISQKGNIVTYLFNIPSLINSYKDKIDDLSPEEKAKYGIK